MKPDKFWRGGGDQMTGTELRHLREEAGLTMKNLAEALECSGALIWRWESERNPIPEKRADQLREVFKRRTETITGDPEKPVDFGADISTRSDDMTIIPTGRREGPVEVRICHSVELGPETMKALKDLVDGAIRALRMKPIKPEVITSARDGDRYRQQSRDAMTRGW